MNRRRVSKEQKVKCMEFQSTESSRMMSGARRSGGARGSAKRKWLHAWTAGGGAALLRTAHV